MIFRRAFSICLMFTLLLSSSAVAQDAENQESQATQESQEPQKSEFEKQVDAWTDVKAKMAELKGKFPLEQDSTKQKEMRTEYLDLLSEAGAIIDDLRDMSLTEYTADPTNTAALKIMMGIAVQDVNDGKDKQVLELGDKLIASGIDPAYFETAASMERLAIDGKEVFEELTIRQKEAAADNNPRVVLKTEKGDIVLELFEDQAPGTVGNFVSLVKNKFYDGLDFHRVIDGFRAQAGCPAGDGQGNAGYKIMCECDSPEIRPHFSGSLSMALQENQRNTGSSQFFIALSRRKLLDGQHTVFGRVISGMDVVNELNRTHTTNPVTGFDDAIPDAVANKIITAEVLRDRGHEYAPNKAPEETEDGDEPKEGDSDSDDSSSEDDVDGGDSGQ